MSQRWKQLDILGPVWFRRSYWTMVQYTISWCVNNSKIRGYGRWPSMSRAVNKCLSVVVNVSQNFQYWLALVRFWF